MEIDVYKEWLGIPEGDRPPDHYQLLRLVQFEDEEDKIRKHYKKLNSHVRKYATGTYSIQSQELLNELAKAMLCLTDAERKRDYDESQGREFEDEPGDILGRKPLLNVLVDEGVLTRDQIAEVEQFADLRGLSNRDAVVQMKLADPEVAARALAKELGMSFVDLSETFPDDNVLDKLPRNVVKRHSILPLFVDDDVLLVACTDEADPELEDELRLRYGVPMRPVLATPLSINQGIAKYYAPGMRDEVVAPLDADATKAQKKSGKNKKDKTSKPRATAAKSSPEQKAQRKQIGLLLICWAFILPAILEFVVYPLFFKPWPHGVPYSSLVITPIVAFFVTQVYWK
ncbi:MAG: general secretion pathway protein GspE [Planctomycetota bacterium]|nr:general secretion pathway protein GspE [Planctomycetota bacterium]